MDIKKVADKRRKYVLARAKRGYKLARSLGFDSYVSNVMAQWSEKRIREFTNDQNNGKNKIS